MFIQVRSMSRRELKFTANPIAWPKPEEVTARRFQSWEPCELCTSVSQERAIRLAIIHVRVDAKGRRSNVRHCVVKSKQGTLARRGGLERAQARATGALQRALQNHFRLHQCRTGVRGGCHIHQRRWRRQRRLRWDARSKRHSGAGGETTFVSTTAPSPRRRGERARERRAVNGELR